jgi:hypothetical protein
MKLAPQQVLVHKKEKNPVNFYPPKAKVSNNHRS